MKYIIKLIQELETPTTIIEIAAERGIKLAKLLPSTLIINCPWVKSFTHYPLGHQPCEIPMVGTVGVENKLTPRKKE